MAITDVPPGWWTDQLEKSFDEYGEAAMRAAEETRKIKEVLAREFWKAQYEEYLSFIEAVTGAIESEGDNEGR